MKTIETLKNVLPVANLFIIGGALTFLLTGFVADVSSGDEVLAEKETSTEPREVKTWRWEEMYPSDMREALEEMPVAWVVFHSVGVAW